MAKVQLKSSEQAAPLTLECQSLEGAMLIRWEDPVTEQPQEHVITVESSQPGEGWLNVSGMIVPFFFHQDAERLYLWIQGRTYTFERVEARRGGRSGHGAAGALATTGEIKAPMPGTVLQIKVQPGEAVAANQPLVIMESMKMEMTLSAPVETTVESVHCTEGQLVEMGAVLVTLAVPETTTAETE